MCPEISGNSRRRCCTTGEQRVGPGQRNLVAVGQVTLLMLVSDAIDEILAETGLTGLVESNLCSKPAAGDPSVSQPDQLLHIDRGGTV